MAMAATWSDHALGQKYGSHLFLFLFCFSPSYTHHYINELAKDKIIIVKKKQSCNVKTTKDDKKTTQVIYWSWSYTHTTPFSSLSFFIYTYIYIYISDIN